MSKSNTGITPMNNVVSAGGILTRNNAGTVEVLCITTKDNLVTLPKGHVKPGETLEQTATRELREEVGLTAVNIIKKLGIIKRLGTEQNREKTEKQIHYFLVDGATYTYDHEENYVWIDFDLAAKMMNHTEERELLISNRQIITAHPSSYFSTLQCISDYDGYPWQADPLSRDASLVANVKEVVTPSGIQVVMGVPTETEISTLTSAEKIICIPTACMWGNKWNKEVLNRLSFTRHDNNNLLDNDLPERISLFYSRLSLNLSDTKTFFCSNQVVKKMLMGGHLFIEGRSERDGVVSNGKRIGPNLILADDHLVRVWTKEYVANYLVKKLGLLLINQTTASHVWRGSVLESRRFILKKVKQGW